MSTPISRNMSDHHRFHHLVDVLRCYEGHFHIDLGELRLAVGPEVLVAEAAGELVVPLETGHHQQLLEQLRRLRKCVEAAGLHPAGHQVVPGPFRSGPRQDRRLDFIEPETVHRLARGGGQAVPGAQHLLQPGTAKVKVAIPQP